MSAFARFFFTRPAGSQARRLWLLGSGLLGVAALSACSTVSLQPGAEGQPGMYGNTAMRAPVVESSMYSDGRLVGAPAGHMPATAGQPVGMQNSMPAGYPPAAGAQATMPADPASAAPLSGYHLQAGTFSSQTSAENVASAIRSKAPQFAQHVRVLPRGSNWRVLIGPFATDAERAQAAGAIRSAIGSDVVNAAP